MRKRTKRKPKRINVYLYAAKLRKRMTPAECRLWVLLQRAMKSWGVVFEAQGVVGGRFIADFVCYEKRLIVEVNGSIHRLPSVKRKDAYRANVLRRLGYTILVYENLEVFRDAFGVLKDIRVSCAK